MTSTKQSDKLVTVKDQEVFKLVSDIGEDLRTSVRDGAFSRLEWYRDRLDRLTGAYMYLSDKYRRTKVARANNEVAEYVGIRSTWNEGKFVSAVAERQARNAIASWAEAEHVFEGYLEAANQGILTLKKSLEIEVIDKQIEAKK
ncbi:MAG: hypothetical protein E2O29_01540 [Deltaproteobacteria bacterium]|nr:MAG: hypothetical protein E2O29_01540 [Deltaproteobacteria bacterium]